MSMKRGGFVVLQWGGGLKGKWGGGGVVNDMVCMGDTVDMVECENMLLLDEKETWQTFRLWVLEEEFQLIPKLKAPDYDQIFLSVF